MSSSTGKGGPPSMYRLQCDEWFTSVDCRWPGATHDWRILRNSDILHSLEMWSVVNRNPILLADSGYGAAPWIPTPYKFDNVYALLVVKRCFGQVERRFPLIAGRMNLNNIPPTIVACMILHNCAKFRRDIQSHRYHTGDFGQFLDGGNQAVFTTNATVNEQHLERDLIQGRAVRCYNAHLMRVRQGGFKGGKQSLRRFSIPLMVT